MLPEKVLASTVGKREVNSVENDAGGEINVVDCPVWRRDWNCFSYSLVTNSFLLLLLNDLLTFLLMQTMYELLSISTPFRAIPNLAISVSSTSYSSTILAASITFSFGHSLSEGTVDTLIEEVYQLYPSHRNSRTERSSAYRFIFDGDEGWGREMKIKKGWGSDIICSMILFFIEREKVIEEGGNELLILFRWIGGRSTDPEIERKRGQRDLL